MPCITDIKPTKRPGCYSIYVDGRFAFVLGNLELSSSKLRIGTELSVAQLADWQAEATRAKLRSRTLDYLAIRPRSRWEVEQYLRRKDAAPADIEHVVVYVTDLGYLDDLTFAKAWVESRQATAPRSRLKLAAELRAKGVARDIIDEALGGEDRDAQIMALQSLINKKRRLYPDDQKLINYCTRQGFAPGLVREVLRGDD